MQPNDVRSASMDGFVRDLTDAMLDCAALTDAERAAVIDAIRHRYERAGLPWPGLVVWAPSPMAGQLLAAGLARRYNPVANRIRSTAALIRRAASITVGGALAYGIAAALCCAGLAFCLLLALPGDAIAPQDPSAYPAAHWRGAWIGGVVGGLLIVFTLVHMMAVDTRRGVRHDLAFGLFGAGIFVLLGPVPAAGLLAACVGMGLSWLVGGFSPPSEAWVTTLLMVTLAPAVAAAAVTGIVVKWRTDPPAPPRYTDPAHDRLRQRLDPLAAVYAGAPALSGAPAGYEQLLDEVRELTAGVDRSVELAVEWATRTGPWVQRYPVAFFSGRYGGRMAAGIRLAAAGAPVPAEADAFVRDFAAVSRAGWWWPHTRFVVVSGRPSALHLERVGGVQRLHRTDGPAAEWPDGTRVYAIHGVGVPADLVEDGWDVEAIHRHPNSEVRRAAIELVGWADYIHRAGWRLLATAPDPGNPPHELALYEDPRRRLRDVRVLVMTNGSPDRSGTPRRHAETVPDTIDDPVAAAAWQYGCPVEVYRQLRRRT